jgi:hypothetical protein
MRAPTAFHVDPEGPKPAKLMSLWLRASPGSAICTFTRTVDSAVVVTSSLPNKHFGTFGLSGPA